MFETNIFGYNKIWGITKYLGSSFPECPPVAKGLGNRILPQFSKTTCLGIRHNNHLQAFRPPPENFIWSHSCMPPLRTLLLTTGLWNLRITILD